MRFPNLDSCEQPGESLLAAYARHFATTDRDRSKELRDSSQNNNWTHTLQTARLIGQSCLEIHRGNKAGAKQCLSKAKEGINTRFEGYQRINGIFYTNALLLGSAVVMLECRNQPKAVRAERQKLHCTTVDRLRHHVRRATDFSKAQAEGKDFSPKAQDIHTEDLHAISKLTMFGLINRYNHPWAALLPVPQHHEVSQENRPSQNYSALFIESHPNTPQAEISKIKVRSGCSNFCRPADYPHIALTECDEDITIVSGHCDLDTRRGANIAYRFAASRLLFAEVDDTITPGQLDRLDYLSDRLLSNITSDTSRHGLVKPDAPVMY